MITAEQLREKLDYDPTTGVFLWRRTIGTSVAGKVAGHVSNWGYIRIHVCRRKYYAHRLAWLHVHGAFPEKQIDHIDGNKKNNAIGNLRLVTESINQLCNNKPRRNNTTGFIGVQTDRGGRFTAQIKIDGKQIYLGCFGSAEDAYAAYWAAKSKHLAHHGIKEGS